MPAKGAPMNGTTDRLGPSEAARVLGMSPQNVKRLAAEGKLPAELTPLGRLFKRSDVERLAAERARADTPTGAA